MTIMAEDTGLSPEALARFIGRSQTQHDVADPGRVGGLIALLDHATPPWAPETLPPLGHWLCFPPNARQSLLGADGHPVRDDDGLLPSIDLPRRMWAGSRLRFLAPVPLGAALVRHSELVAAVPKSGKSGRMVFATVAHRVSLADGTVAIEEEQDIVFREAAAPGAPFARPAIDPGAPLGQTRALVADSRLLFRYSAVTFNGHRIHYDRDYTVQEEGYPGLVVHGPLIATLLIDHFLRLNPGASPTRFEFRAASPLFEGETITLDLSDGGTLRAIGPAGLAMSAKIAVD
jgi:3-methylfumaryl-CoA hydratase